LAKHKPAQQKIFSTKPWISQHNCPGFFRLEIGKKVGQGLAGIYYSSEKRNIRIKILFHQTIKSLCKV